MENKKYMIIVAVKGNPNLEIFAYGLSKTEAQEALKVANGLDIEFSRVCEHSEFNYSI